MPDKPSIHFRFLIKRMADIAFSLMGLLFLSPLFAAIAIAIKRGSPGPVFYHGKRIGKGGKYCDIRKFRTRYEDPARYAGPRITGKDDPRITPMGRWLRSTKLNELPQLWNVLIGDMNLVGPRPEDPEIVANWTDEMRMEILSVRPGITSPASVLYRDEEHQLQDEGIMDTYLKVIAPDKQRLDQLYVRNYSFLLDMDVLLWTFLVLLPKIGYAKPPESFLFSGPFYRFVGRYLNWFVIDTLVSFIAVAVSGLIWRSVAPLNIGWQRAILVSIGFTLLFSLTGSFFGVQRIEWTRARGGDGVELVFPTMIATFIALLLNALVFGERQVPMQLILFAAGLSFIGYIVVRYRSRLLRSIFMKFIHNTESARAARERIVILGGGQAGEMAAYILRQIIGRTTPFEISGFIDDDLFKQGVRIAGLPILGNSQNLECIVKEHDVGVLVFAIHNISQVRRKQLIDLCKRLKIKVVVLPDILQGFSSAIGANGHDAEKFSDLAPLFAGWPGIALGQVDSWLAILEDNLNNGKIGDALFCIKDIRKKLVTMDGETIQPMVKLDRMRHEESLER